MAIDEDATLTYLFLFLKTLAGLFVIRVVLFFGGYTQHIPLIDTVLYAVVDVMRTLYDIGRGWAGRFGLA